MEKLPSSSLHTSPLEFCISSILFLLYLCDAWLWKKRVFWSPSCSHKILDLCLHIFSSLISKPFISHFNWLTLPTTPPLIANSLAFLSYSFFFFFPFNNWVMFPKLNQLHWVSFAWHSWIFPSICSIGPPTIVLPQVDSTMSLHPRSSSHICSNLHGLLHFFWIPFGMIIIGLWSDEPHSKWTTFVARNSSIQSVVAIALSNLSQIILFSP